MATKNSDRPSWDKYFLSVCEVIASRSHDENTKVGCVITDERNRIVSTGYNGFPAGVDDKSLPSNRVDYFEIKTADGLEKVDKYDVITHAEANAIASSRNSLVGCTIYLNLFPCSECAKLIITAGIKKIIYKDKRDDKLQNLSHLLLSQAKVEMIKYEGL